MRERIAEVNVGFCFFHAFADFFQTDGGVEDDGDDPEFEQSAGKGEELNAWRSQHSGGHVWGQRAGLKSKKEAVR